MDSSLAIRNTKIYEEYLKGEKLIDIAGKYSLAVGSVKNLVFEHRSRVADKVESTVNAKPGYTNAEYKQMCNVNIGDKIKYFGEKLTVTGIHPTYIQCKRKYGKAESILWFDLWFYKNGGIA